jgi:hypothetical protein
MPAIMMFRPKNFKERECRRSAGDFDIDRILTGETMNKKGAQG